MQFNHKPAKMLLTKQGKSEGFDSCNQPRNLTQNWIQIFGFLAHVTWKFDGRTRKTIGHLFYTKSSCVHHFKAISEFKLELQSGNAKFESKLVIFFFPVTSKFDRPPWKTIGHLFYATSSFVFHFIAICQFKMELQSGNAKFVSKSVIFLSRVTLRFDGWLWTRQIWGIW